jgi:hypothetical protein
VSDNWWLAVVSIFVWAFSVADNKKERAVTAALIIAWLWLGKVFVKH